MLAVLGDEGADGCHAVGEIGFPDKLILTFLDLLFELAPAFGVLDS
jgi:hypothetical protein